MLTENSNVVVCCGVAAACCYLSCYFATPCAILFTLAFICIILYVHSTKCAFSTIGRHSPVRRTRHPTSLVRLKRRLHLLHLPLSHTFLHLSVRQLCVCVYFWCPLHGMANQSYACGCVKLSGRRCLINFNNNADHNWRKCQQIRCGCCCPLLCL